MEVQIKEKDEKLATKRSWVPDLEIKVVDAESRRIVIVERLRTTDLQVKATQATTDQAIEEYKRSKDFKNEMVEGCLEALHLGFLECKKEGSQAFQELNLSAIVEFDDECEEEVIEGGSEVKADPVGIKEVVPKATTEVETTIEDTIVEVIVDAKAMMNKVVKAFDAVQSRE